MKKIVFPIMAAAIICGLSACQNCEKKYSKEDEKSMPKKEEKGMPKKDEKSIPMKDKTTSQMMKSDTNGTKVYQNGKNGDGQKINGNGDDNRTKMNGNCRSGACSRKNNGNVRGKGEVNSDGKVDKKPIDSKKLQSN